MASHGSIYLVAFTALFCLGAHASDYFGDSATTMVTGVSWVESAVPATSTGGAGYYLSKQAQPAGLYWYPNGGSSVTLSTDVTAGLAINAAGTKLWAMQAGSKVTEWDVASNSLAATYTLGFDGGVGGGLCLDGTETTLYATGPGWEITPQGQVQMDSASDVNGVASIDLSTGTVTNLKTNEPAEYAFNGCVVDGNTLYAVQFQRGVGCYDISTGTWTQTVDWSSELVALQDGSGGDPNLAGDGLTLNDGTFYVSMWNLANFGQATASNSAIWACDPSCTTSCCTKLEPSAFAAADIGNFNGQLVIPEVLNGEVSYRPFAAGGTTTGGMMGSTTTGGMMGSTTTSDMMGSTTEMAAPTIVSFDTAFVGIDFAAMSADATVKDAFIDGLVSAVALQLTVSSSYIATLISELVGRRLAAAERRLTGSGVTASTTITVPASDTSVDSNTLAESIVTNADSLNSEMTDAAQNTAGMGDVLHDGVSLSSLSATVDTDSVSVVEGSTESDKAARPFLGLGLALVTSTLVAVMAAVAPPVS
jgi:hypothetical protein